MLNPSTVGTKQLCVNQTLCVNVLIVPRQAFTTSRALTKTVELQSSRSAEDHFLSPVRESSVQLRRDSCAGQLELGVDAMNEEFGGGQEGGRGEVVGGGAGGGRALCSLCLKHRMHVHNDAVHELECPFRCAMSMMQYTCSSLLRSSTQELCISLTPVTRDNVVSKIGKAENFVKSTSILRHLHMYSTEYILVAFTSDICKGGWIFIQ